jgi:hypothetical protein
MGKIKVAGLWVMVGLLAVAVAGCAKPPLEEQKAAQAAKDAATSAQAEMYAVNTMNEAMTAWNQAETKMQGKAYQEAKDAYVLAKTTFEKAAGEVEAGKKAVMDENQTVLKALEQSWAELDKLAKKAIKKMKADMKTGWAADSQLITAAVKAAKDVATDPAAVKKSLAEANQLVEKWLASLKK